VIQTCSIQEGITMVQLYHHIHITDLSLDFTGIFFVFLAPAFTVWLHNFIPMRKIFYSLSLPLLLLFSCNDAVEPTATNDVVIGWNNLAVTVAEQHDHFYSFVGVRTLTMTHVAMHDALNAISMKYIPYAFNDKKPDADLVAACSQAAYTVLAAAYPKRIDTLQKELKRWLDAIPESAQKKSGIDLGQRSAEAILQLRKGDGHEVNAPYTPRNVPGAYQFTHGFKWVINPDLKINKPFVLQSVDQFRVSPPPALNSEEYANDFNEVKTLGVAGSKARTKDQTNYGHWWAEFGEHGWNRIGRITAAQRKLPIHETARMFALVNMTLYDYYLATCDSKYHYDTWRPVTAIQNADKDGNAATAHDTSWQPEMITAPLPEYPSGHSGVGTAGATIISAIYGTKEVSFEMESVTALPEGRIRSFQNLDSAADECARSRIMNGYHFRFSTVAGKEQGRKVAQYIVSAVMGPVAEK
jgi:hypothetical protein